MWLGSFLVGSFFSQFHQWLNNPSSAVNLLGTAVPQTASFFLTYLALSAFWTTPFGGLGIIGLLIYWVKGKIAATEAARARLWQEQYAKYGADVRLSNATAVSGVNIPIFAGKTYIKLRPFLTRSMRLSTVSSTAGNQLQGLHSMLYLQPVVCASQRSCTSRLTFAFPGGEPHDRDPAGPHLLHHPARHRAGRHVLLPHRPVHRQVPGHLCPAPPVRVWRSGAYHNSRGSSKELRKGQRWSSLCLSRQCLPYFCVWPMEWTYTVRTTAAVNNGMPAATLAGVLLSLSEPSACL